MTDVTDQTVVGSNCMFYRRQSRGVLLKNNCDTSVIFAVEQKSSGATDQGNIVVNVSVAAQSQQLHGTGGSENVISVGIGS